MNSDVLFILMYSDSAIDNPTYDECQGTSMANNLMANLELEKDFENPIYGDDTEIGVNSTSKTNQPTLNTSLYVTLHEKTKHIALKMIFELRRPLPTATFELVFQQI